MLEDIRIHFWDIIKNQFFTDFCLIFLFVLSYDVPINLTISFLISKVLVSLETSKAKYQEQAPQMWSSLWMALIIQLILYALYQLLRWEITCSVSEAICSLWQSRGLPWLSFRLYNFTGFNFLNAFVLLMFDNITKK